MVNALAKIEAALGEHKDGIYCGDVQVTAKYLHQDADRDVIHIRQIGSGQEWLVWSENEIFGVPELIDPSRQIKNRIYRVAAIWGKFDHGNGISDYKRGQTVTPRRPDLRYWKSRGYQFCYAGEWHIITWDIRNCFNDKIVTWKYEEYKYLLSNVHWLSEQPEGF